jgi:nitroreductase
MLARRQLLRAGAAALAAGGGALAWRAEQQGVFSTGEGPAYDAWRQWNDGPAGSPHRLVRAAILAASPHNTQPWRYAIKPGWIDLHADRSRHLGAIDPLLREMHIGLGCALENLLLAAPAAGWQARVALFPNSGDPGHVARVTLARGGAPVSPLLAAIPLRHTNRGAYDPRPLPESSLRALSGLGADLPEVSVRFITGEQERRDMGARIVEASQAIVADAEQSRDSSAWFRSSWQEIQQKHDGLTIDAQALPDWMRVAAKMLPPASRERADRYWIEATRDVQVATAPAFGLLLARDPADNMQRVQGGRLWQRMHLWAQAEGLAMQPLNQMAERADREQALHGEPRFQRVLEELSGAGGWRALMPFRIGLPTVPALASPRRAMEEVLLV